MSTVWLAVDRWGVRSRVRPTVLMADTTSNTMLTSGALSKMLIRNTATNTSVIVRSEEHTSELQSLMRISYAVFCLKKKKTSKRNKKTTGVQQTRQEYMQNKNTTD